MQDMFVTMTMTDGERYEERFMVVKSEGAATVEGLYQHARQTFPFSQEMRQGGGVVNFGAWPNAIPAEPGGR